MRAVDKVKQAERKLAGCCVSCNSCKEYYSSYQQEQPLFKWFLAAYKESIIKDLCFQCWMSELRMSELRM